MASFSNDVKEELCAGITDKDKRYACLYGILLYCKNFTENHICFTTECKGFADLFGVLLKSVFNSEIIYQRETGVRKNGQPFYSVSVSGTENVKYITDTYNIKLEKREINLRHIVNNSLNVFLAGVFFICGSVSDPYKEYHLEFSVPDDQLYLDLHDVLLGLGIEGRKTQRKGNPILYIKDSENIEDILTFIGARQGTIDLMNIKIYKDVRNKANRIANCDSANIDKVISAAMRQLSDIEYIKAHGEFENLPADLMEVSELRIENPEASLQEIGELLSKPIGRSGVTRRFQKISKFADEIRKQQK
ncbi:DNA-binding protein WhiA, partial [Porcipelethomonas sp.]|uniref:DNA-binding protein WhiA n=1 Tax=Porcipelethomonas sp. TaxID=2981675 RepID=UPI003EF77F66